MEKGKNRRKQLHLTKQTSTSSHENTGTLLLGSLLLIINSSFLSLWLSA